MCSSKVGGLRYRIISMLTPRVAGTEALESHPPTFEGAILFYCFQPIRATGGRKAALSPKERRYSALVKAYDGYE